MTQIADTAETGPDATTGPETEGATARMRGGVAALALSLALTTLNSSIASVALPKLAEAFAAPFQQVQWIVIAYLLTITTLIVSVGRLGDIVGRRTLLLAGLAVFTAASVLCGLAPSLWLLIAGRAVQGVGAAVIMALTMAFVGETVPKERTGSAMGLLATMSAVGTALGPSLGGLLLAGFGWHAVFLVNVPLGLAALALGYRYLPRDHAGASETRARFDIPGTILLAGSLAAYALAVTAGNGHFGLMNVVLLGAAVAGIGLFVLVQATVSSPLVRLGAFRQPGFGAALAMNVIAFAVISTTMVVGPFYLAIALALNETVVGLLLSIGPASGALSGVVAGRVVDRFGAPSMVIAGLVEMAVGSAALAILPVLFGIAGYVVGILLLVPGYILYQSANNTAVMMNVDAAERGVMSGLLNLSRNLGLMTGASVLGAVFAFSAGASDITAAPPQAVAFGMQATFLMAAGLICVALAIAARGRASARREDR